jgi:hypothetical protein
MTYCSQVASESQGRRRASQNTCRKRFDCVRGQKGIAERKRKRLQRETAGVFRGLRLRFRR